MHKSYDNKGINIHHIKIHRFKFLMLKRLKVFRFKLQQLSKFILAAKLAKYLFYGFDVLFYDDLFY